MYNIKEQTYFILDDNSIDYSILSRLGFGCHGCGEHDLFRDLKDVYFSENLKNTLKEDIISRIRKLINSYDLSQILLLRSLNQKNIIYLNYNNVDYINQDYIRAFNNFRINGREDCSNYWTYRNNGPIFINNTYDYFKIYPKVIDIKNNDNPSISIFIQFYAQLKKVTIISEPEFKEEGKPYRAAYNRMVDDIIVADLPLYTDNESYKDKYNTNRDYVEIDRDISIEKEFNKNTFSYKLCPIIIEDQIFIIKHKNIKYVENNDKAITS